MMFDIILQKTRGGTYLIIINLVKLVPKPQLGNAVFRRSSILPLICPLAPPGLCAPFPPTC